jgi:hypothetical protein
MVFIATNALHVSGGSSPIIRSSKLYIQHRVFVEIFLLLIAIVGGLEQPTQDSGFELLMMGGGTA